MDGTAAAFGGSVGAGEAGNLGDAVLVGSGEDGGLYLSCVLSRRGLAIFLGGGVASLASCKSDAGPGRALSWSSYASNAVKKERLSDTVRFSPSPETSASMILDDGSSRMINRVAVLSSQPRV